MEIANELQRGVVFDRTIPLPAGVPVQLVLGIDTCKQLEVAMRNALLVNAIGTTVVENGMQNDDASYAVSPAGAAIGSIAASAGPTGLATYSKDQSTPGRYTRFTWTSAGGTTIRVQAVAL